MTRNLRRASRTPQRPFDNASQVYEVEAIGAKRRKGGNTEYFVLWKDHQPSNNTWEPMSNLEGSEALVNDFEKTWQENYDAAEAKASQDHERRRQNARQPHDIVDSVRITVTCHDTRLSGFGLEARIEDQKLKQELKTRN